MNNHKSFKQYFMKLLKRSCYYRTCIGRFDTAPTEKYFVFHMIFTEDKDNSYRTLSKSCELRIASPYKTFINLLFQVLTKLFNLNIIIFRLIPIGSYTPLHKNLPGFEASPEVTLWHCLKQLSRFHIDIVG